MSTISSRIDAITHIPEARFALEVEAPRSVKIELTGRCNFACSFCARSDKLRKVGDINWIFYTRILKEMREAGVEELGLFYLGESFLYPLLESACHYAKEDAGYPYVFLTTNGSLATYHRVKELFGAGLDSLKFSLNYADGDQLNAVARVNPRFFNLIKNNIKDAYKLREEGGYSCGLYASYIEYDGEQGERMQEVIKELSPYLDEVYALPLYSQADLVTDRLNKQGKTPTSGNRGRAENLVPPLPCWSIFTEGHITYTGLLTACCFDHREDFVMGDLNEMSFMDAWNGVFAKRLRRAHLEHDVRGTPCENCIVRS